MIQNRTSFHLCFSRLPEPVADVWTTIASVLTLNKCLPKEFILSQIAGHPEKIQSERDLILDVEGVTKIINDRNLCGFRVDTGHSKKSIGFWLHRYVADGQQTFLNVRIEQDTKSPPVWNGLIEALLLQWQCIGAWQWNTLYRAWQECSEVKGSNMFFGGVPDGFRRYLQPPVDALSKEREMIDISLNPGRKRTLLPAVDFRPASEMWLGPDFWQYATCTKEDVLAADFFIEKNDTPNFLYLKCWPHPFTRPDGEQGRMQQRLWKLFFHEDCEWPPGSGGISDVPVYGPPELLPGNL